MTGKKAKIGQSRMGKCKGQKLDKPRWQNQNGKTQMTNKAQMAKSKKTQSECGPLASRVVFATPLTCLRLSLGGQAPLRLRGGLAAWYYMDCRVLKGKS